MKILSTLLFFTLLSSPFAFSSSKQVSIETLETSHDSRLESFDTFAAFIIKEGFCKSTIHNYLIEAGINPDPKAIPTESILRLHMIYRSKRKLAAKGKEAQQRSHGWERSIEDAYPLLRLRGDQVPAILNAPTQARLEDSSKEKQALVSADTQNALAEPIRNTFTQTQENFFRQILHRDSFEKDQKHYKAFLRAFDEGEPFSWAERKTIGLGRFEEIPRRGVRSIMLTETPEKKEALMEEYKGFNLEFSRDQHGKWTEQYMKIQKEKYAQ